jgi:hypothetical protein
MMPPTSVETFMSDNAQIDAALAKLEAGKFSFQMVEAIKAHIAKVENELETTRGLHAAAIQDLQHHQYVAWRLENEVQKLNARIHQLVRANVMAEKADRAAAVALAKMAEYFEVSKKYVIEAARSAAADLKEGRTPEQVVQAKAQLQELYARVFNERTAAEIEPYVKKAAEGLEVARKHALQMAERLTAYLSTLHKTAA